MNVMLGIRMAFAGGRESLARMGLMALGVAAGVTLLLLTLTGMPIMQGHVDRLAWHRTHAASAPSAPDPAYWLATTDHYAGREIIRVHVAALGPRPPIPPGVQRLPGPGEVVLSPALAQLIESVPDDQLRQRFPGRIVGSIGPPGLLAPAELVGIVGRTPMEMENLHGAQRIVGIEQPAEPLDLAAFWGVLFFLLAALVVGPVVVFVSMVTRIGGARRDQRLAAIRLAGATRFQTATLAATETVGAALAGTALGWLGFQAMRPVTAQYVTLGHGMPIFLEDVAAPPKQAAIVLVAVPLLAVFTTLVTLRPVQLHPLGVHRRARRRPPTARRLIPLVAGIVGQWLVSGESEGPESGIMVAIVNILALLSLVSTVVGLILTGAWVCMWISRGMARLSSSATMLIVARRIAADPYSTFRSVSGAALAMFVATTLGLTAAKDRTEEHEPRWILDAGIVALHVQGVPEQQIAHLLTPGAVVVRTTTDHVMVVRCADLARLGRIVCPYEAQSRDDNSLRDVFVLDKHFSPNDFMEPFDGSGALPVQTVLMPTDGSVAAQERLRTEWVKAVPALRSTTNRDLTVRAGAVVGIWEAWLPAAIVFVLLVAACSLTVAAITGLLERRRPFAILRACGVRLTELRRIVMLETGVPLVLTVLGGVGVGLVVGNAGRSLTELVFPSTPFLGGLAAGLLAALAVSAIALPFMEVSTRHESVRFE